MSSKPARKASTRVRPELNETPATHSHSLKIRIDDLKTFQPLTNNQKVFFDAYNAGDYFIALHGVAGTGKTLISIYKALEEVLSKDNPYKKLIIIRSSVQGRDQGFLPGDQNEKMEVFSQPYKQICETLFGRKDAWNRLVEQGYVEFVSTSFLRGCTFDNSIIVMDEFQNETYSTLETVITRSGNHSKIIFCGDVRQIDIDKKRTDMSGAKQFMDVASSMSCFTKIEFGINDIVRSSLVKDFIIAALRYIDTKS
jgi:predicted ribonuclease YlaK